MYYLLVPNRHSNTIYLDLLIVIYRITNRVLLDRVLLERVLLDRSS